ncbi:hypothetical protein [Streptacidiphilus fuscans]|uniref:Uncharacterized protein n=1 Tax=Streptacidiphilus fuscans TaxID=2789292 RepID=A0A931B0A6_9ACTN|nr:hypothetical protein [Streptacidiphilus fuscans]MBF9068699.1 hypothetical protein [Streptacidiphilus fuscans]
MDQTVQQSLVRAAARNNADWCEAMCRAHGLRGEYRLDAWTSRERTPRYYPDAVTLTDRLDVDDLLARVDRTAPGVSVKDSFAALDLAGHGFQPLLDAYWIAREPELPAATSPWQRLRTAGELAAWEIAWCGEVADLFLPPLLEDPSVLVMAAPDLSAGALLSLGAGVVGVSNLFVAADLGEAGREAMLFRAWHDCLAAASVHCPGLPVVGYERGADLAAAERVGFTRLAPLRVWQEGGTFTVIDGSSDSD